MLVQGGILGQDFLEFIAQTGVDGAGKGWAVEVIGVPKCPFLEIILEVVEEIAHSQVDSEEAGVRHFEGSAETHVDVEKPRRSPKLIAGGVPGGVSARCFVQSACRVNCENTEEQLPLPHLQQFQHL